MTNSDLHSPISLQIPPTLPSVPSFLHISLDLAFLPNLIMNLHLLLTQQKVFDHRPNSRMIPPTAYRQIPRYPLHSFIAEKRSPLFGPKVLHGLAAHDSMNLAFTDQDVANINLSLQHKRRAASKYNADDIFILQCHRNETDVSWFRGEKCAIL